MDPVFILINVLLFLFGLGLLLFGGELLVRGCSSLARSIGISPIVIGFTVVAFGTSSPEFLVCLTAALKGSSDIAIGNIVGSNISNIGLILGITAVVYPILVNNKIFRVELPVMVLLSFALLGFSYKLELDRLEGLIMFLCLTAFIFFSYKKSRADLLLVKNNNNVANNGKEKIKSIALVALGLAGLIIGANLVVDKSVVFARSIGISELVIGITAVAIGTSLPELSASIIAAIKKEHDLIIGNIIGSNIFNIGILGLVSAIQPVTVNGKMFKIEYPFFMLFTLLAIPFMRSGFRISRVEGLIFLILYMIFVYLLF